MEYHWYEDYWKMPRNLPRGHAFAIGFLQAERLIRNRTEYVHSDQSFFFSMATLMSGYRLFIHFANGIVREVRLGEHLPDGTLVCPGIDLERMLLAGRIGALSIHE